MPSSHLPFCSPGLTDTPMHLLSVFCTLDLHHSPASLTPTSAFPPITHHSPSCPLSPSPAS
ncbi:hypothetical protein E2C01_062835 [Portunus trituberculatus]|uniref:Uncharacterized protein n=1 Tax=Portunus trituberculatus TaxID=210409 RepID=A0A5B7HC84_PORTR|nr:hypothetical protein [Portunus trituberculatus]